MINIGREDAQTVTRATAKLVQIGVNLHGVQHQIPHQLADKPAALELSFIGERRRRLLPEVDGGLEWLE